MIVVTRVNAYISESWRQRDAPTPDRPAGLCGPHHHPALGDSTEIIEKNRAPQGTPNTAAEEANLAHLCPNALHGTAAAAYTWVRLMDYNQPWESPRGNFAERYVLHAFAAGRVFRRREESWIAGRMNYHQAR